MRESRKTARGLDSGRGRREGEGGGARDRKTCRYTCARTYNRETERDGVGKMARDSREFVVRKGRGEGRREKEGIESEDKGVSEKERKTGREGERERESAEREGGGGRWWLKGVWAHERARREGGTVNSPIQCSYHLPLSLTTHRHRSRPPSPPSLPLPSRQLHGLLLACLPACLPACLACLPALPACLPWLRLADVPCLTGKLNRYFTVSYPPPRLHTVLLLRLPFSLSCLYRVLPFPLALLPARSSCPAAREWDEERARERERK